MANGQQNTVGGGGNNTANGQQSTVGGGFDNTASGDYAVVPGGSTNHASGNSSFAVGRRAKANDQRAFVWADSQNADFASNPGGAVSGANYLPRTQNGAQFVTNAGTTYLSSNTTGWQTASSRAGKTNVESVDPERVLAGVSALGVSTWEYRNETGGGLGTHHMGPMAEEFYTAFDDLGDDDASINSINADGVAFAAIQGLSTKLDQKNDRIDDLQQKHEELRERCETVENRLTTLEERVADLAS